MIRAAIIEDERESQDQLQAYMERYGAENGVSFSLARYEDGLDFTEDFRSQYDIIFCDIMMKHMDGMKTAEYIRQRDSRVIIVFITNLAEYAIRGYEVDAIGYLLKPINYNLFSRYLGKALGIIDRRELKYLVLKEKKGMRELPLADICYFLYEKHYIYVHMVDRTERIYLSMRELEVSLTDSGFVRCNSGCIVNLKYVQAQRGSDIVVNGDTLVISRSRRKEFSRQLAEYLGGI